MWQIYSVTGHVQFLLCYRLMELKRKPNFHNSCLKNIYSILLGGKDGSCFFNTQKAEFTYQPLKKQNYDGVKTRKKISFLSFHDSWIFFSILILPHYLILSFLFILSKFFGFAHTSTFFQCLYYFFKIIFD